PQPDGRGRAAQRAGARVERRPRRLVVDLVGQPGAFRIVAGRLEVVGRADVHTRVGRAREGGRLVGRVRRETQADAQQEQHTGATNHQALRETARNFQGRTRSCAARTTGTRVSGKGSGATERPARVTGTVKPASRGTASREATAATPPSASARNQRTPGAES